MAGEKIAKELDRELEKIERECLRPLQAKAFHCSSECCKDQAGSHESLQRCLESCMKPVVDAQDKTGNEVNDLQDRLNRCALNCQDVIKDSLGDSPGPQQQEQAQRKAEECLLRCEDTHIALIAPMVRRLRAAMNCK